MATPVAAQSVITFDDQGFNNSEVIAAPLSISEAGYTIVFEDVNTTATDFQYDVAEGGTLNYDQTGELEITSQSGNEIDAQSIELTLSYSGLSTDDATITGYRDGSQVAQLTNVSFGNSSDPQEQTLTGFSSVDRIVVKVNSFDGTPIGSGVFVEFDDFTFAVPNNAPQFENAGPFAIAENPSSGASVGDVDANDGDGGATDADVTYAITGGNDSPDGDGTPAFAIDATTGVITVNDPGDFDFETQSSFTVSVEATDGNGGTASQDYDISVTNVDEAPVFTEDGPFNASEGDLNGTAIGDVDATDGDGGSADANVTYTITSGNPNLDGDGTQAVSIDAGTGVISIVDSDDINFEVVSGFNLTVQASDGSLTTDASVTINVTDINEVPAFTATGPFSVGELASNGDAVGDVDATDGDGGMADANVTYSIADGNDDVDGDTNPAFAIDGGSGAITVNDPGDLDFETQSTFTLTVEANDGSLTGSASVTVDVTDVDEAPVFTETGPFSVGELASNGTTVGDIDATDGDGGAADENVTYAITAGNDNIDADGTPAFALEASSGVLTVADTDDLNFDVQDTFTLTVEASDGASQSTASTTVTVTNANPPTASITPATNVTATTATLRGTVNPSGLSTTVEFEYFPQGTPGDATTVTADQSPLTGSGDQTVTADVSGLSPATQYSVRVIATNSDATTDDTGQFTTELVPYAIVEGGVDGLDRSFSAVPDAPNQPVGVFTVGAQVVGASLSSVSLARTSTGGTGVSALKLYASSDAVFEPSSDTELESVSQDPSLPVPLQVTFNGFSESLPAGSPVYLFVAVDLTPDAEGDLRFTIADETNVTVDTGQLANVNGASQTSFTDLPLSSDDTPLPVELTRFEATGATETVTLSWTTASERNNAGFYVERKVTSTSDVEDDVTWETLGFRKGATTTTESTTYTFTAEGLDVGTHTFRLRQVDLDGTTTWSDEVTARSTMDEAYVVSTYPNPMRGRGTVSLAVKESQNVRIELYDLLGRHVALLHEGSMPAQETVRRRVDLGRVGSGTYFVRVVGESFATTEKVVVVR